MSRPCLSVQPFMRILRLGVRLFTRIRRVRNNNGLRYYDSAFRPSLFWLKLLCLTGGRWQAGRPLGWDELPPGCARRPLGPACVRQPGRGFAQRELSMLQGIVGAETHSARGPGGNDLGCSSGSSNCLPWLFNNTMKIIVGQQQIHEPLHFSALETAWGTRYETNMKENMKENMAWPQGRSPLYK